ncbi:hypothetical protein EIN_359240 [Entamoeba invadens IP1]|uniref:MIB/HERC2 domain-containing protein n=2 Tax=Entamoeba invadens TaxID=33085 RepID=A0A0A1UB68_ENTIV|nr:hypothetical protein EIN_359240 [Entamoeba invadens IP1]ELP90841.1 hypothetical protein EIN_359240 [Entamoeba invadens IP1]BAN41906.1 hypothetical protein [Entamoeba invadens]|eukprot:XP_004257612.1 hypothetical protein EIN_359240 [Entamoeba invadens IP1]
MSLSVEEKTLFVTLFKETVASYSAKINKNKVDVLLDVLPLIIKTASEELSEAEKALNTEVEAVKADTEKLQAVVKRSEPKKTEVSKQTTFERYINIGEVLGKRVERGENWKWENQDGGIGGRGVVVSMKASGWVKVRWDINNNENRYRYGSDNCYDIKVVAEEKEENIPSQEDQYKKPAQWLVGKSVIRGRDWKWEDQDGGNGSVGIVTESPSGNWVEVRWKSGSTAQYRWGEDGCYDLLVVAKPL